MKKSIKFLLITPLLSLPFFIATSCNKKPGENAFCISNQNLYADHQSSGYIKIYNPVKDHIYAWSPDGQAVDDYVNLTNGSGNELVDFSFKSAPSEDMTFQIDILDNDTQVDTFDITVHSSEDDYTTAQSTIQDLSFVLRAGKKYIQGGCFNNSAVFGTGWICKKDSDGSYDLMTNWHIKVDADAIDYSTLQFAYLQDGNIVGWEKFTDWHEVGHGHLSTWSADTGTDMFEYNVKFGNDDANLVNKISRVDSHALDISDSVASSTITSEDTTFFIGGFPGKANSQKTSSFDWTFTACHAYTAKGYNGLDWNNHSQGETIGHFTGDNKHYSVGNEVIMGGIQCNMLKHGASGSLCLVKVGEDFKIFGVYWGGWIEDNTNEFFGSIEPFNCDTAPFTGTISGMTVDNWSAYTPSTLFN